MALWQSLIKYNEEVYPMHMPGHKGGRYKLIEDLYKIDVTEVPDTDHLYNPKGILKESMEKLADFYGTKRSVYLVNGSTVGVLSAIGGITNEGDEILIARNCHQSVYNALTLYDLIPKYIYPKMSQWGLVGGIDPKDLSKELSENPKIVAFVMTSPTYEGFISDISGIQKICRRYNVVLIVDEAHGAHLPMTDQLPISAVECGADIVIHSMHKTLPTFTGSGLMHMNLPPDMEARVLHQLQILQTSSPSYVMMAQMDACVEQLGHKEDLWKRLLEDITFVEKKARKLKKFYMLTSYSNVEEGIVAKDPLKNVVMTRGTDINGQGLSDLLRSKHHYQMEMASEVHTLAIFSVADKKKALKGYFKALKKEDKIVGKNGSGKQTYGILKKALCQTTPFEAHKKAYTKVSLEAADGKVIAHMITPYPPGIPVLVSGEVMTKALVEQIQQWLRIGIEVVGVQDGMVDIIIE